MGITYFLRDQKDFEDYVKRNNLNNVKNEPLFTYKLLLVKKLEKKIVIITSRMALKWLLKNPQNGIKIIIVGKKSAELAKTQGEVIFIAENVQEIIDYLQDKNKDEICYLRGNYITQEIKGIEEIICYNIDYKKSFSVSFISDLVEQKIANTIFFSFKSSEEFLKICINYNLTEYLKTINASVMNSKSQELLKNFFYSINITNPN